MKNTKILAYFRSRFLANVTFREPSWKKRNTKDIIIGVPELVIFMTLHPHRHTCGDFVMGTPLFAVSGRPHSKSYNPSSFAW